MFYRDRANFPLSINVEHGVLVKITGFRNRRIAKFDKPGIRLSEVAADRRSARTGG
jgi:hypothetical protein